MKIRYLGTAAAEAMPALFCECERCKKARELGGRNIRTRSQAIVDDTLLLDFPCDTYFHIIKNNIDLSKINNLFITHSHQDHFYAEDLKCLYYGFSKAPDGYVLTVHGSDEIKSDVEAIAKGTDRVQYKEMKPFVPLKVQNYTVTALKALHGTKNPYFYLIEKEDKAMLYAHDTDYFLDETWAYLEKAKPHLSLVSLDCTNCTLPHGEYHGHMGIDENVKCKQKLLELGLIDENTKVIVNHFSHNGTHSVYDELVPIAAQHDMLVSYDGMEIEF